MSRIADELPHRDAAKLLDAAPRRLAQLQARRKLWLKAHLWLGLVLGFFLALFGLTGSLLVFYDEIDQVLNADVMTVHAVPSGEAAFRPFGEIFAAAEAAMPAGAKLGVVEYPTDAASAYAFGYQIPQADGKADEWKLYVDPYRATVTGQRMIKKADALLPSAFIPFVFRLHYALLAEEVGGKAVGFIAVALLFSVLTGLIVWWPLTGRWRRALSIKRRASVERLNHDLHQTAGFYTFPLLFAVLLSGIYMNLPDPFVALVKWLSPATRNLSELPRSMQGPQNINLAQALEIARARFPDGRLNWMSTPADADGAHVVSLRDVPGQSRFWSERQIFIDRHSGAVLVVRDPGSRQTLGEGFIDWQWPLHSGKAFGWPGRIAVFLTGLACPLLFVTGVVRWLQKRRCRCKGRRECVAPLSAETGG